MHTNRGWQRSLWLVSGLGQLLPLAMVGASWWWLHQQASYSTETIFTLSWLAGAITSLLVIITTQWRLNRPLGMVMAHLRALEQGDSSFRTVRSDHSVWDQFSRILNRLSDQLEQLTQHNQVELSVITAEAKRLRHIINSINDGVVALDQDAHIILFNKAAATITGFSLEEAAGQPVSTVLPLLKGNSLVLNDWLGTVSGSDIRSSRWENLRLKTKAGKTRAIDAEILYQGADPNGVRALITFHDRTQAQELEDMKVDFVALAAHELRTPVSIIRGYLEILDEELAEQLNPQQRDFMQKLSLSASQLSGFINNILHVSRIEHGDLNLKLEALDWTELVKTTMTELEAKAKVQNKRLTLKLTEALPPVAVDKMSIIEVLNNLVDNALKYSPANTTVTVTVRQNGPMVETIVQDQGLGIPENAIDKLFTKFYRSHRTRTSHRGTGLGLYMSKAIVEAHGGSIWVHSRIGEGSTFGFMLPVYNEAQSPHLELDKNNLITRGVHGWIKNHSLYRG